MDPKNLSKISPYTFINSNSYMKSIDQYLNSDNTYEIENNSKDNLINIDHASTIYDQKNSNFKENFNEDPSTPDRNYGQLMNQLPYENQNEMEVESSTLTEFEGEFIQVKNEFDDDENQKWPANQNNEIRLIQKSKNMNLIKKWKKNDKIFSGKYSTGATPKPQKQKHHLLSLMKNQLIATNSSKILEGLAIKSRNLNDILSSPVSISNQESPISTSNPHSQQSNFSKPNKIENSSNTHWVSPSSILSTKLVGHSNSIINTQENHWENSELAKVENTIEASSNVLSTINEEASLKSMNQSDKLSLASSEFLAIKCNASSLEGEQVLDPLLQFKSATPKKKKEIDDNIWENQPTPDTFKKIVSKTDPNNLTPAASRKCLIFSENEEKNTIENTIKKENKIKSVFAHNIMNQGLASPLINPLIPESKNLSKFQAQIIYFETAPLMPMLINFPRFEQDFIKLDILGQGNFGTVYKCQNKLDGLIYAVKCMNYKLNETNSLQILEEAHTLASLSSSDDNPFVVRYYNAWIEDDKLFLVMEHCQHNLKHIMAQPVNQPETYIRQMMRDICMGLRHLHQNKIVHLDIKPTSILYAKTNKFKLGDLGEAKITRQFHEDDIKEEESRYIAPELLVEHNDTALPDLTKADIYSFGVIIWEMLTRLAYVSNYQLACEKIEQTEIKSIYSKSLRDNIKSMINPSPSLRPTASNLLADFLQSEIEVELNWERKQNAELQEKLNDLEKKLKIRRKKTF